MVEDVDLRYSDEIEVGNTPNPEIVQYFEARTRRLDIVATTYTASGQILDWVPIASQNCGSEVAEPPPPQQTATCEIGYPPVGVRSAQAANMFELEDECAERGPPGTVPVVRKDFSRIAAKTSLRRYLAKRVSTYIATTARRTGAPPVPGDPDPFGYFHATAAEDRLCFGAEAVLNVFDPSIDNSGDHSLMQLGLLNMRDLPKLQSLEVGWQVSKDHYGDFDPHLFVYYTTNGYEKDDDYLGGYNRDVDGWIQVSDTIFPAARIVGTSVRGGDQYEIAIKCQLYRSNWWVQVQGNWIGYYPASLYMGNQSVFSTLGDHGDRIGFWGEVFTVDRDPNATTTQMGSGSFGEGGWGDACYQRNLRVQTDRGGTMADATGSPSAENASYYDIVAQMESRTSWRSHFFAGGPGANILWMPLGGQWPGNPSLARNADGRLELFLRGYDSNLYHLWQTAPNGAWSAPWEPMGGQWHRDPVVARNRDGRLEIFIVGDDTSLYHLWQTAPSNGWSSPWASLGGQWHHQPVVAANEDGRLEIFIVGDDAKLYHLWQTAPNNGWSAPWASMGGQWHRDPVVARNQDGRLEIFIVGDDGNLYHRWQTAPNNGWSSTWEPMGGQWHHQPAVAKNLDGRLEIFIVGDDANLYHLWQTAPNNGWSSPWASLGGQWPADPTVARNADGRLEIFTLGVIPYLYHRWQTAPNNGWYPDWIAMPGSWHRPATVGNNQDGRLEIFIVGDDGNLYHAWQTTPSNGWARG
jgi:acylphosphatase